MEDIEQICCQIISAGGTARSVCIEAIYLAKEGKIQEAKQHFQLAEQYFSQGQKIHFDLLKREAEGNNIPFKLLLLHAESMLMTVDDMKIMAEEFISVYEKLLNK
ncbi:MAG: PTS lactose/cellobiose transporter subunit IIA [Erysipelotrichia bacterium]|nr:PTS lactose/cellobiose transporter subunit IIA [Erysipelotrichia bacterium]